MNPGFFMALSFRTSIFSCCKIHNKCKLYEKQKKIIKKYMIFIKFFKNLPDFVALLLHFVWYNNIKINVLLNFGELYEKQS